MNYTAGNKKQVTFIDYIKIIPQYLAPHFLVTKFVYWLAQSRNTVVKNIFITWFRNHYKVDMSLAQNENATSYESFNAFFTRSLKPDVRPLDSDRHKIICPVDGAVSQIGHINGESIFQAKGHTFTLHQLLAGQDEWCKTFHNGAFTTIYLSPKDYHRIHMPCSGTLKQMSYVPGKLFSVSPLTARMIPGVFARNERILCFFDTDFGPLGLIMVGAMIVGGMETVWHGCVTPPHRGRVKHWHYTDSESPKLFNKGEEMGRFNIGSTVILLFPENCVEWNDEITCESTTVVGQPIATLKN